DSISCVDSFVARSSPYLAVQPLLGILPEWRFRTDRNCRFCSASFGPLVTARAFNRLFYAEGDGGARIPPFPCLAGESKNRTDSLQAEVSEEQSCRVIRIQRITKICFVSPREARQHHAMRHRRRGGACNRLLGMLVASRDLRTRSGAVITTT